MSAALVLTNGRIVTFDPGCPQVTAVAVQNGRILAIGDDEAMKGLLGSDGEWVDLGGRTVTPGLVDAHVHFQGFALSLQRVNLDGAKDLDEALDRVAGHLRQAGSPALDEWLLGRGWVQDEWPSRAFPTAAHLDRIIPDRPACLHHKSGHAAWVNSLALKVAGIDAATADPPGGQIQRDAQGRPTGILFEDASDLVTKHIPRPTEAALARAMQLAQEVCWRVGLTGLHDFDGRACFRALQLLRQRGKLGLRIIKNIPVARLAYATGVGLRSGFGDDWLRIGGVKIFADGALGPRTAAMIAPYEGEASAGGNVGIVVTDKEEMMEAASEASAHGLSVTVHAIGDRANHEVLDVFEAVRAEESRRAGVALRHRIEHVQLLHPQDLNRLAQLNIIASMQPIHATSDMEMADNYWGERAQYSYAWRTMLDTGAALAFGSDCPVEPIGPLLGLYAAVTRRRADGFPGPDGWRPEQKLTMTEAVRAFTMGAAYAAGQEARQGSITPGKLADFTIFPRDIFTIPADELLDMEIAGTIVGGRFRRRTW
ncbi:MAG: amidohydrolase [Anaerolineae bacterium]